MKYSASQRKSDLCFPSTDAITAYRITRETHDAIHKHVSSWLREWGLSVPKYGIILQLYDHECLPISEISNLIFRGNSNLTTLMNRMERDGLVERFNDDRDRRMKKIRLTEKGKELAPKIISEYRIFLHQMMTNCLRPDEQIILINLLNRVKDSLRGGPEAALRKNS